MNTFIQNRLIYLLLVSVTIILLFNNCEGIFGKDDGDIVRKEMMLSSFKQVSIYGIYNVVLRQDTIHKLIIEGVEDFITDIEAQVRNDTLIIKDIHKNLFRIEERPTLYLHFTDIKHLWTLNPVKVTNEDTLKLDRFYYYPVGEIGEAQLTVQCNFFGMDNSANTLGRFYIKGTTQTAKFYNRYGSSIYADGLKAQVVEVYNESIGDVYVNADELLKVFIWGTGNIYYSGDPVVQIIEKRSSGQVGNL